MVPTSDPLLRGTPPATITHLSLLPAVTTCRDPGDAEHSRRVVSNPKFPVGATVQYVCDKGYVLAGAGTLTCHDRAAGGPKWSDRLPKCIREWGIPSPGISPKPMVSADATVPLPRSGDLRALPQPRRAGGRATEPGAAAVPGGSHPTLLLHRRPGAAGREQPALPAWAPFALERLPSHLQGG